jgi:hypothetical protein
VLDPGALLHARIVVPDRQGGAPESVLGVLLELRDAAGRPAVSGPAAPPALSLLENAPTVWETDLSAPTVPGVYHPRLSIRRRNAPTQILSLPALALTIATPRVPLRTGLVYARDGNLWLTALDGSRTRALTFYQPAVEQAAEAAWAPGGARLAYTHRLPAPADEIPGREIWSLTPDGRPAQPLVRRQAGEDLFAPAWTPDGAHLLVSVDRVVDPNNGAAPPPGLQAGDESWAIDEVDLGSGARRPFLANAREPDVSRDGTQVVYLAVDPLPAGSVAAPPPRLMLARLDPADPQPRRILPGDPYQTLASPRLSPDGQWVAFAAPNPGGWEDGATFPFPDFAAPAAANGVPWDIYLLPATGGPARRLTHLQADGPGLAWSPDSRSLAVLAGSGLYRVGLDGTLGPRLAPGAIHSTLSWPSP